eukprot:479667_1
MADGKEDPIVVEEEPPTVPEAEKEALQLLLNPTTKEDINNATKTKTDIENDSNLMNKMRESKEVYPYRVARLDDICVSFIAFNFNSYPILDSIPSQYVGNIVNNIDLSKLVINRAAKHVECSKLWQQMASERWENCRVELHGSSWKRLYLENHITELLESYYPSTPDSNINWNRLLESIKCSSPFIHSIKLNQLPSHLDLSQILPLFNNLSSLDVTYRTLNVGMNYNPDDFGMNLNDALNISKYLQNTKSLSTLRLSECLIDDETVHILMGGLQQNNTITTLDLSYNKISDVGARRLSAFLSKKDNVLMALNLNNNQINDEGVTHIASTLKNKHLQLIELDLSLNNVSDAGAINLFESLAVSECMQILNVSCNHITNASFVALINMVKINTSIHTLNVSGNAFIASGSGRQSRRSSSNSNTNSISTSASNSRPHSRHKDLHRNDGLYGKQLADCLLNDNLTIVNMNLLHIGLSKLEMKTINQILMPRKVKSKQSQRKAFLDKSWQRLQTVLTIP